MDSVNMEMLRQAANAARDGDYQTARELVHNVLEQEEENVRAWLMLARLTEDVNERRMALSTVLQLDPSNERARQMMTALDAVSEKNTEVIPGISRRQFQLMMGGLVGLVLVLLLFVVFANNRQSTAEQNDRNTELAITQVAQSVAARETSFVTETQQAILEITQAWLTEITPTSTPTATATVTPTPTPTDSRPSPIPPPADLVLSGVMVMWAEFNLTSSDNLPLAVFDFAQGQERIPLGDDLEGMRASISPDGTRVLYLSDDFSGGTILHASIDGEQLLSGLDTIPLEIQLGDRSPGQFSPDGTQYVFIARADDNNTREVYLMNLPLDPAALRTTTVQSDIPLFNAIRLTTDELANYSYPIFSPDGTRVLVVREDISEENPGNDLAIINIANRTRNVLTNDRNELAESHMTWSPVGNLIVYSAIPAGAEAHNLYFISADGLNQPIQVTMMASDDIYPQYSPDGRYVAFSSNRGEDYNVFLVDMNTREVVAQITSGNRATFLGNWVLPDNFAPPQGGALDDPGLTPLPPSPEPAP